ncbi:integrin beta-PS isoform X2 [Octopus bimaculoides]|nr:integrin beta-PS isoform X1 [Octopus bimaculoides]XP_052824282.1 integrin beta-PS isoform X2 [Octopus bimaculoides]
MMLFWQPWLLVLLIVLPFTLGQSSKKHNICQKQITCGACITAGEGCSWCSKEVFPHKRCDNMKSLIRLGCEGFIDNPDHSVTYVKNDTVKNANGNQEAIQIQPQKLRIKIRPNKPYKFKLVFRLAEDYPVDLYYLMDLSNSMADDKEKLASLGNLIAADMSKITKDFRLGFGSFVDKTVSPYISIVQKKMQTPCAKCTKAYGFKHQLTLDLNTSLFANKVYEAPVSGNLDSPEGGFDAIMQSIVCDDIGWRDVSRRMLVFSTDSDFHYAGDGKLGGIVIPNDGHCHLNKAGEYTLTDKQDYPSIGQLANKIQEMKVNVIFAVTSDQLEIYKSLSKFIEGSTAGRLDDDSSNIVSLIRKNYQKITSKVELNTIGAENVTVKFFSSCVGNSSDYAETNKCKKLKIGEEVTFDVSIEVHSCSSETQRSISIYPVGLKEKLTIDLDMICECECEKPKYEKKNYALCNNSGTYECGACTCNEGHYGKYCECDGSDASDEEALAKCIRPNSTTACSGRGDCVCGICDCFPRTTSSNETYSGDFCECDDYSCDYYNGKLCGGEERGHCECGLCKCNEGFKNSDCGCATSNDSCIALSTELICNGQGHCDCGTCKCFETTLYRGPTCEECPTCPGKCNETKACVQCSIFQTGQLTVEECGKCQNIVNVKELRDDENLKHCRLVDEDDCIVFYTYEYNNKSELLIEVKEKKSCPTSVNVIAIVVGVIVGIVAVGLALLLIWKLITTIQDHRELAKFENERNKAQWNAGENPIYKPCTTVFKNPQYVGGYN